MNVRTLGLILTLSITVAFGGYSLLENAWHSATTVIAIHSILAFLTITCSGFILVLYRVREDSEQTVFHAALFYAALINIGRAIRVIFDNNLILDYGDIPLLVTDLVYLGTFSILIFVGVLMKKKNRIKNRTISVFIPIIAGLAIHLTMVYMVIPACPDNLLKIIGLTYGLATSTVLSVADVLWMKTNSGPSNFELTYMIAGYIVFGIAWIPFTIALFIGTTIWTLAFPLMTFGLILLSLSVALPFHRRTGLKPVYSFFVTIGFALLGVLPTGMTVIVDTYFAIPPTPNRELFIVLHFGSYLMAAIMSFLMYHYDSQAPHPKRRPIVTLFITWATIEMYQVAKGLVLPEDLIAQSIVPYLIGSIFFLMHIPYAIKWTKEIPTARLSNPSRVVIVALIMTIILLVSEIVEYQFLGG
ncbi:MAG: hypothetical protein ACTSSE_07500 [Candidatus Thorarchaeota archaeon]